MRKNIYEIANNNKVQVSSEHLVNENPLETILNCLKKKVWRHEKLFHLVLKIV